MKRSGAPTIVIREGRGGSGRLVGVVILAVVLAALLTLKPDVWGQIKAALADVWERMKDFGLHIGKAGQSDKGTSPGRQQLPPGDQSLERLAQLVFEHGGGLADLNSPTSGARVGILCRDGYRTDTGLYVDVRECWYGCIAHDGPQTWNGKRVKCGDGTELPVSIDLSKQFPNPVM